MKYKVIKSFPGYNEGDFINIENSNTPRIHNFNPALYPEFFQLIEEKKSVWDLKDGDRYCFINSGGYIITYSWFNNDCSNERRDVGNCFLTQEQAEKELEKRKIITLNGFVSVWHNLKINFKI